MTSRVRNRTRLVIRKNGIAGRLPWRNVATLLEAAARSVFARTGVDAPAEEIADLAGVGTLNQHFLGRPDLIVAVLAADRRMRERSDDTQRGS